jgi:hypothetical protein
MTHAPVPRFEIGRVLSRMVGVISRNFQTLALLSLLFSGLPTLLVGLVEAPLTPLATGAASLGAVQVLATVAIPILSWLTAALLQAALIHVTVTDLNGGRARIQDALGVAIRHVFALIAISILSTLACLTGLVLLIVPGVILALALCVAASVRVVENRGVFDCLARSAALTRHHRGALLLIFLLLFLVQGAMSGSSLPLSITPAFGGFSLDALLSAMVVRPIMQAASTLLGAAAVASTYFELRTIKEGVSVEALAAAFD